MARHERIETVRNAGIPFETMMLFRYVEHKDAVWIAVVNYFEKARVRGCDLDAIPMADFPEGLERDTYLAFCEAIRNHVEAYWKRADQIGRASCRERV